MPQVAVMDFGGQYAHLIARRVRDLGYSCEVYPWDCDLEINAGGYIFSGGPESVNDWGMLPEFDFTQRRNPVPILGICFGMQLIAQCMGGTVSPSEPEYGNTMFYRKPSASVLMSGVFDEQTMWMSHRDSVTSLWEGARVLGSTDRSPIAAFEDTKNKLYGVQFHPEVTHSTNGSRILASFLSGICILRRDWEPGDIINQTVDRIRERVGDKQVMCALSGGVDSVVAAALTQRAVGGQLRCFYVDTGLMRFCDMDDIYGLMAEDSQNLNISVLHRQENFVNALVGVTDPEEKRRIIGHEFINVFQDPLIQADFDFLLQGTIRSDVIESGGGHGAATIKSHHNVGGLPAHLDMDLLEPLRGLYKDEVRKIGRELGLPDTIVDRQPFPGPGFAIRIIGEVTGERAGMVRKADEIVRHGLKDFSLWQAFAVLLPVQSVGVQGDSRTYENTIVVRAVTSEDAMTADWADLPKSALESVSTRITNEVPGVNRVVYDITSKPPGTIEWE